MMPVSLFTKLNESNTVSSRIAERNSSISICPFESTFRKVALKPFSERYSAGSRIDLCSVLTVIKCPFLWVARKPKSARLLLSVAPLVAISFQLGRPSEESMPVRLFSSSFFAFSPAECSLDGFPQLFFIEFIIASRISPSIFVVAALSK